MPFLGESHSQTQHLPNRKGGSNRSSAMIQCQKSALSMPKKDCRHRAHAHHAAWWPMLQYASLMSSIYYYTKRP